MSEVKYNKVAKPNTTNVDGVCSICKEVSRFRVFQAPNADGFLTNRLACVVCLNSVRYHKNIPVLQHSIILKRHLTTKELLARKVKRFKEYIFGNRVRGPFGRKRLTK